MYIECEVPTEGHDTIIVSFDAELGFDDCGMGVSIGSKEFKKPGEFRYKWLASDLTRYEVEQLVSALVFTLDHLPQESDICNECASQEAS